MVHNLKGYFEFRSMRTKCLRLSRELYKIYLCDIESKNNKNIKCFWSYVHRFKKGNSLPQDMYLRDRSASGRRSICNLLAEHLNDVLISIQIDEQEHLVGHLVGSLRIGWQRKVPPFFVRRLKFVLTATLIIIQWILIMLDFSGPLEKLVYLPYLQRRG